MLFHPVALYDWGCFDHLKITTKAGELLKPLPSDDFIPTSERARTQLSTWLAENFTDWDALAGLIIEAVERA